MANILKSGGYDSLEIETHDKLEMLSFIHPLVYGIGIKRISIE